MLEGLADALEGTRILLPWSVYHSANIDLHHRMLRFRLGQYNLVGSFPHVGK